VKTAPADLYRTLGLPPSAAPDDVRRAFRAAVRRHHPDGGSGAVAELDRVVHAYRSLGRLGALTTAPEPRRESRRIDLYA